MTTLLLTMLVLPFATALTLVLLAPPLASTRAIALGGALATGVTAVALASSLFEAPPVAKSTAPLAPRVLYEAEWFRYDVEGAAPVRVSLLLGIDGVGMALALATALVTVSCVLASWHSSPARAQWFYAALLSLEGATIGQFLAFDLVSFYVFFEFTLIPVFFLLALWGGAEGRAAATRAFVFLFTASVFTLCGLALLTASVAADGLATPCSIPAIATWLQTHPLDRTTEIAVLLLVLVGLLAKTPATPLHTWLPQAHAVAPTAANALFAGALLKPFGLLRLCLPLFPVACTEVGLPLVGALSAVAVVYGSLCALAQTDLKKLLAYSSVAHMGACTLGLFALNIEGLSGGVVLMVAHGLATAGLFLLIGALCDRYGVREISAFGGLAARMPLFGVLLVTLTMASIGLPGLVVFAGELLAILGMFKTSPVFAAAAATGVVLGAWYLLSMVARIAFGPLKEPATPNGIARDLRLPELVAVASLAAACLWLGVRPQPLIDCIRPDLERVAALYADERDVPEVALAPKHLPAARTR
ncbi:MAG: complex I subunit 4 family protein [Lacipirellulaceae bacterium]